MELLEEKLRVQRETVARVKEEGEAQVRKEQESLTGKLAEQKKTQELEGVRAKIVSLKEKRQRIVDAQVFLNSSADTVALGKRTTKESREAAKVAAAELATQTENLETLISQYPEVFKAQGIETATELASSPEYPATENKEIADYKGAEGGVLNANLNKKAKRSSERETIGGLKKKRTEVQEGLPDLDIKVYLKEPERSTMRRKLEAELAPIDTEIETLQLQTPEGRLEVQAKLKAQYTENFKDRRFLDPQWQADGDSIMRGTDVALAGKYGPELVTVLLREAVHERLFVEVLAEKKKTGVAVLREDLDRLKKLPQEYEGLESRIYELSRKRKETLNDFSAYLRSDPQLHKFLETHGGSAHFDVTGPWLEKLERYLFKATTVRPGSGESTTIATGFFSRKIKEAREFVSGLRNSRDERLDPNKITNSVSFAAYLDRYEKFLEECGKLIALKDTEHIKKAFTEDEYSVMRYPDTYLGFELEAEGTLGGGFKLSDEILREFNGPPRTEYGFSTSGRKSLDVVEHSIEAKEAPINTKAENRKAYLDAKISSEWIDWEVTIFQHAHADLPVLTEKVKRIEKMGFAAAQMSEYVSKARQAVATLAPHLAGALGDVVVAGTEARLWNTTFIEGIDKEIGSANKVVTEVTEKVGAKKKAGRPLVFGKGTYDEELRALEKEVVDKTEVARALTVRRSNAAQLQQVLQSPFQQVLYYWQQGGIGGARAGAIEDVLNVAEAEAKKVLNDTLSSDEKVLLEEYRKLNEKARFAKDAVRNAAGKLPPMR